MRAPLGCLLTVGFKVFCPQGPLAADLERPAKRPAPRYVETREFEGDGSFRRGSFRGRDYVEIFERRGEQ